MVNTRRASFRLGAETEGKLNELAELSGSSRTEVVRTLISARHKKLRPVVESPKRAGPDPSQMNLEDLLSPETGGDDSDAP